jgi:hypothetical protein
MSHATFFGDEATQLEATPALAIERGEKLHRPPALVFQGDRDQWTTVAQAEQLAARHRARHSGSAVPGRARRRAA